MLAPGIHFGSYEVTGPIGSGGMSEVYRATDSKLKRDVALKVLPQAFIQDAERLARFRREAEVLASLNHPNIATIHGLEDADGQTVIVMELVEGPTLAQRISQGPVPPGEALAIAGQIIDALEAAHGKGVVHRDLKPANVMLTQDGNVKILDFGLAKIFAGAFDDPAGVDKPAASMTRQGQLLGTPAYMSPEQARGGKVDAQTDIWAFGCILFELLTGFSPFARATPTETLGKVLERDPDFAELPADVPAAARRLMRRCLEKEKKNRLHNISDARLDIREALHPTLAESTRAVSATARQPRWVIGAIGLVAGLIIGLLALGLPDLVAPSGVGVATPETYAAGPSFPQSASVSGNRVVALSPSGSLIAYATSSGVTFGPLGSQDTATVAAQGATGPFFSSDGESFAFVGFLGLMRVSIHDAVPVPVVGVTEMGGGRYLGGAWYGDTIYFVRQRGVFSVPADEEGAKPTLVFRSPDDRSIAWPEMLPDGQSMLVTVFEGNSFDQAYIALLDLEAGTLSGPLARGVSARYVQSGDESTGRLVYATRNGRLAARGFNPVTREVDPAPVAVPGAEVFVSGSYLAAAFDVSNDGLLARVPPIEGSRTRLIWIDRDGSEQPLDIDLPGSVGYPRFSPGGDEIAFDIGAATPDRRIWRADLALRNPTQVSDLNDSGPIYEDFQAVWSRDGANIFFATTRTTEMEIYSSPADRTGGDAPYAVDPDVIVPLAQTLDGRLVVMLGTYSNADIGILGADNRIERLMQTETSEVTPSLSTDGNWIAYTSNESGNYEIYVAAFPSGAGAVRITSNGGAYPAWDPDGSGRLYYIGFDDIGEPAMNAVALDLADGQIRVAAESTIFSREYLRLYTQAGGLRPYDVSPTDGRFLFVRRDAAPADNLMTVLLTSDWIQ